MRDTRYAQVEEAAAWLRELTGPETPTVLVIAGSGLSGVADGLAVERQGPFSGMPGFAAASAPGHDGRFIVGTAGGSRVLFMLGRLHLYEGHDADRVVLPVRAASVLGCETLIVTNAAGGIRADLVPGRTMLITDHINLTGANPLTGANLDRLGTRFPSMYGAYSERLAEMARAAASDSGVGISEGVYAAVPGPNFETPAEVGYLRAVGADAVGMSTVLEVLAARHAGMEVAGLSLVTNRAAADGLDHEDVLAAAGAGAAVIAELVTGILTRL